MKSIQLIIIFCLIQISVFSYDLKLVGKVKIPASVLAFVSEDVLKEYDFFINQTDEDGK